MYITIIQPYLLQPSMIAIVIVSILFAWSMFVALILRYNRHHLTIEVSHMNRITSSVLEHNSAKVKEFLATSGKANFVLPNGSIIVAIRHDNVRRLVMLENKPSDGKRFVSSAEFNELGLTVPYTKGPHVRVLMRHGQAAHNLPALELRELWDKMSVDKQLEYTTRAVSRVSTETWWSLSEERRMTLTLQELRYDAPLTEKGCEEAVQASMLLKAYLQKHYPHAHVRVITSELLRTYETGALLLATWKTMHTSFSYDTTVYASNPSLNELHREIGSAVHMLGTEGRRVAESRDLDWEVYAQHVLKFPLSLKSIDAMTAEEKQEVRDKVVHITSENIPMPLEKRPTILHGVDVTHIVSDKTCPEYDLLTCWFL